MWYDVTDLIPTLNSSSNGIHDDSEIKDPGVPPAVDNLIPENDLVRFVELNDELDTERILSNQCSLSQNIADLGQAMLIGKVVDILKKLIFGNTAQRIFDSANFQRPVRPG